MAAPGQVDRNRKKERRERERKNILRETLRNGILIFTLREIRENCFPINEDWRRRRRKVETLGAMVSKFGLYCEKISPRIKREGSVDCHGFFFEKLFL